MSSKFVFVVSVETITQDKRFFFVYGVRDSLKKAKNYVSAIIEERKKTHGAVNYGYDFNYRDEIQPNEAYSVILKYSEDNSAKRALVEVTEKITISCVGFR